MPTTLFTTNFDSDTTGTLPTGWTNATGTWLVAIDAPISGTKDLQSSSAGQFDVVLRTGTADVQNDVQTYFYKWKDDNKHLCPVWRSDSTFANAYLTNFQIFGAGGGSGFWFKRLGSNYGTSTAISFTTPTGFALNDTVAIERTSTSAGLHSFRIWNATTGTRPSTASFSFSDTVSPLTTGFSGVFAAATNTPGIDDYTYVDNSAAAATATTLSGPTTGASGAASSAFTVAANGVITGTVIITPNDSSGGGTFSPTSVSINTASPSGTFTYTPASTGTKSVATTNNGGLTNPTAISYVSTGSAVTIARTNAALAYAPYVWDDDGTSKITNVPGYVKFGFTGTSLKVNLTAITGLTNFPVLRAYIDNFAPVDIPITSGATQLTLANSLAGGSHTVGLKVLRFDDGSSGRWTGNNKLKITGFEIDSGATVSAPTLSAKSAIFFTDSLGQGVRALSATSPAGDDSTQSFVPLIADALGAEYGQIAFGGSAFNAAGVGDNPSLVNGYGNYSSGRSRLSAGVFSPAPDYVFCVYGTNPIPGNDTQSTVATAISNLRAAAPTSWIFMVVPPGGFSRSGITLATNAAITAGDTKLALIDLGTTFQNGLTSLSGETAKSWDGVHFKLITAAGVASNVVAQVQHYAEPRRFTVVVS